MVLAAIVTAFLGVDAERRPLEEVCSPLGCEPDVPPKTRESMP
jgi:hypothetical protein